MTIDNRNTSVFYRGGGQYTVVPSGAAPTNLPPGTYGVAYDDMAGYSIVTLPDLEAPTYRVYGRRDEKISKILTTYRWMNRSLGVLFEGDKGIGKSSTTVELARQARDQMNLPIVLVNSSSRGLATFLSSLGEAVIVLDEFEKNFSADDGEQTQFLSLLDGTDAVKRLYIVTVNETNKLNPFFLNRPGRFHYLISFNYPSSSEIREYITNETQGRASSKQIEATVAFGARTQLNYDHLRAIATELIITNDKTIELKDIIEDLNIRDTSDLSKRFDITCHFSKSSGGNSLVHKSLQLDMFSSDLEKVWFNKKYTEMREEDYEVIDTLIREIETFVNSNQESSETQVTFSEEAIGSVHILTHIRPGDATVTEDEALETDPGASTIRFAVKAHSSDDRPPYEHVRVALKNVAGVHVEEPDYDQDPLIFRINLDDDDHPFSKLVNYFKPEKITFLPSTNNYSRFLM